MDQQISELTMLLIYLTGWEEEKSQRKLVKNKKAEKIFRSWKYYKFEIIDALENQGLIRQVPGGKSIMVTEKGKQDAEELKKKYLR